MRCLTIRDLVEQEGLPKGFIYPQVHPAGAELETRKLGDGVFALLSNAGIVDNYGFIVGERGVLVIDAHINGAMAQQIIDAVRRVTDRPILYLVNTNYHGDHTFGNYMFPSSTTIIAQRRTARHMKQFEAEKKFLLPAVKDDTGVYGDVKKRMPDLLFDRHMSIDLGGREVELHYFGPGNTAGDTVVYQPDEKVAWTGNLVLGVPVPPMFDYGAERYLKTIAHMKATLDVKTIVPGHGPMTDATMLTRYLQYSSGLIDTVRTATRECKTIDQLQAEAPLGEEYLPPVESPLAPFAPFLKGLHLLNLLRTYEESVGREEQLPERVAV